MTITQLTPDQLTDLVEAAVLKVLTGETVAQGPQHEIISRAECIRRLGISEPTLISYGRKGKIPEMRIGKAVRYDWQAVCAALSKKNKKSN
jgi:hypothetical protein